MQSRWRIHANKVITDIIKENPTLHKQALRAIISKAYPFGERQYHPYKIWCDEVNKMLLKTFKTKEENNTRYSNVGLPLFEKEDKQE